MTSEYHKLLPKPDPILKEQVIRDSLRMFREQAYGAEPRKMFSFNLLGQWRPFVTGALAATLMVGLFFMHGASNIAPLSQSVGKEDLALLQEMKDIFGDKLAGVVRDGDKIEPILASDTAYTDSQPLIITIRKGDKEIRIMSFSGNNLTLPFDHQKLNLSAMVTNEGSVIVEGENFVWSHGQTTGVTPLSIEAKTLGSEL